MFLPYFFRRRFERLDDIENVTGVEKDLVGVKRTLADVNGLKRDVSTIGWKRVWELKVS